MKLVAEELGSLKADTGAWRITDGQSGAVLAPSSLSSTQDSFLRFHGKPLPSKCQVSFVKSRPNGQLLPRPQVGVGEVQAL